MKANKKETDPWDWAKAWTSKTQKKKIPDLMEDGRHFMRLLEKGI